MTASRKPEYDPKALFIWKKGDDYWVVGKVFMLGIIIVVAICVGGEQLLNELSTGLVKMLSRF